MQWQLWCESIRSLLQANYKYLFTVRRTFFWLTYIHDGQHKSPVTSDVKWKPVNRPPTNLYKPSEYIPDPPLATHISSHPSHIWRAYWYTEAVLKWLRPTAFERSWTLVNFHPASRSFHFEKSQKAQVAKLSRDCSVNAPPSLNLVKCKIEFVLPVDPFVSGTGHDVLFWFKIVQGGTANVKLYFSIGVDHYPIR